MKIITEPNELRNWSREQRKNGQSIGIVPTMGALHEGHSSLLEASVENNDATILTIFVNPAQFAPHEDFDTYPRTFEGDCKIAAVVGVDVVYAPNTKNMYPRNYASYVEVERLQDGLCGGTRPHFFKGVATVVAKLFNAADADRAYFGLKDGQQIAIIKRMVRDLDFGVEIVALPTVREQDGLAMSSRNKYLTDEERKRSLCISQALFRSIAQMKNGCVDSDAIIETVRANLYQVDRIDYVSIVDADEMTPVDTIERPVMLAIAVFVGETRLIDNIRFEPTATQTSAPDTLIAQEA